jgi:hypothetical protein
VILEAPAPSAEADVVEVVPGEELGEPVAELASDDGVAVAVAVASDKEEGLEVTVAEAASETGLTLAEERESAATAVEA